MADRLRHRPAPRHRAPSSGARWLRGSVPAIALLAIGLGAGGAGPVGPAGPVASTLAAATLSSSTAAHVLEGTDAMGWNATPLDQRRDLAISRSSDRESLRQADATRVARAARAARQARIRADAWHLPTRGYHLTARFGSYDGPWSSFHTGLDFAAPTGTPIFAVATGRITGTGWAGAYGNRTIETLPDGTELWYAHQSAIDVSAGQRVDGGQVIGAVGSTGNTTGPHVHLEVRPGGGDPVDPYSALIAHGVHP
jgi:murein DD-endopeptidase MepM/ murein hydrolase activator NlpD